MSGGAADIGALLDPGPELPSYDPAWEARWDRRTPCSGFVVAESRCHARKLGSGLVDATIIASASKGDSEAHWVKHKGRPAVHGFKAHVGADAETALVEEIAVTPANVNDGRASPAALPNDPDEVFADSAYRGSHFTEAVRAGGGAAHRRADSWRPKIQSNPPRLAACAKNLSVQCHNPPAHRSHNRVPSRAYSH